MIRRTTLLVTLGAAVGLAVAGAPWPAAGQGAWTVTPSFTLTEEFDSNIDGTATNRRSDFITLFTPGLSLTYASPRFTLQASGSTSAAIYAEHSDLNTYAESAGGGVSLGYQVDPRLSLTLAANYSYSRDTADFLFPATATSGVPGISGVDVGRQSTHVLGISAGAAYQIDPRTSASGSYGFTLTNVDGGSTDAGHGIGLALSRQLTPIDTGRLAYTFSLFEGDESDTETSHAVTVGWGRSLGPNTSLSLEAGPRFEDDEVNANASASLSHRFQSSSVSLGYSRSQRLVVGQSGPSNVDTVTLAYSAQLLRELSLGLAGSASRIDDDGTVTTLYTLTASASYAITRWMSAQLSYRFFYEDEDPDPITRHVVALSLSFSYPFTPGR